MAKFDLNEVLQNLGGDATPPPPPDAPDSPPVVEAAAAQAATRWLRWSREQAAAFLREASEQVLAHSWRLGQAAEAYDQLLVPLRALEEVCAADSPEGPLDQGPRLQAERHLARALQAERAAVAKLEELTRL